MNEQEVEALEKCIAVLSSTITDLRHQITELQIQITGIEDVKRVLVGQLPKQNRIDHLFK